MSTKYLERAVFGGGCFWCMDAVFRRLRGVEEVISGYAGGTVPNPTDRQVYEGNTGHAEVVSLSFDPQQISYEQLLSVFFSLHDPTTLNRQQNDVGEEYRSVIFFVNDDQEKLAKTYIASLMREGIFTQPIVTAVQPLTTFYPADRSHQDYYAKNPDQGYCRVIIDPKIAKLRKSYQHLLRD